MDTKLRVAFIKARWHSDIVDQAHLGFVEEMDRANQTHEIESFDVPGAYEMPLLALKLGESGRFDAIVAAAFVVDGGIYRHDFVAQAVVSGLMQVQFETRVPTFSVSLTPHNFQPVVAHIAFFRDHFVQKGAEAAQAVMQIHRLDRDKLRRPLPQSLSDAPC